VSDSDWKAAVPVGSRFFHCTAINAIAGFAENLLTGLLKNQRMFEPFFTKSLINKDKCWLA
jgi:hypothetical protein